MWLFYQEFRADFNEFAPNVWKQKKDAKNG